MERKRIINDGKNLLIGKVLSVLVSLLNMMILARILSTEEMGTYSLVFMFVNMALTLGLNWSSSSVIRHGREEYVKIGKINKSFWARLYIFVPVIILFVVLFLVFHKQITYYVGISSWMIVFPILLFLFNGMLNYFTVIYQSIDKMRFSAYIEFGQKFVYLVGLALLYIGLLGTNLTIVLLFLNTSFIIALLFNVIKFDFKLIKPIEFDKKQLKKIWDFSWPQLIGFSGLYVINYVDLYVIKQYMTLQDVGVYSVAYQAFMTVLGFLYMTNTLFMPLIVEYKTSKRFDRIQKYVKLIPLATIAWAVFAIIGIILSDTLIPVVFSTKYTASIDSFKVLLIASIFTFVAISTVPLINAFDIIKYQQFFNIIASIINIVLDFMLIPIFGIIGAAYATLIAYVINMLLNITLVYVNRNKILGLKK